MSSLIERLRNHPNAKYINELREAADALEINAEWIKNLRELLEIKDAEIERLREAIYWALGENGDFPIVDGPPYYRWRTELRVRSGLRPKGG